MDQTSFNDDNITNPDHKTLRQYFTKPMWRLLVAILVIYVIQIIAIIAINIVLALLAFVFNVNIDSNQINTGSTYITIILGDIGAIIALALLSKGLDKTKIQEHKKVSFSMFLQMFFMTYGMLGLGMLLGYIVTFVLNFPLVLIEVIFSMNSFIGPFRGVLNVLSPNPTADLLMNDSWLFIIIGIIDIGIIGPIVEELIFRKYIFDHTCKYGISGPIIISSLLFGLFHGNFTQFFYAMFIGLVLGALYAYSGKIKYTILLHMSVNLYSSLIFTVTRKMIAPEFTEALDSITMSMRSKEISFAEYGAYVTQLLESDIMSTAGMVLFTLANIVYYSLMVIGVIVLIVFVIKHVKKRGSYIKGVKGSFKAQLFNWPTICVIIIFIGLFLMNGIGALFNTLTSMLL